MQGLAEAEFSSRAGNVWFFGPSFCSAKRVFFMTVGLAERREAQYFFDHETVPVRKAAEFLDPQNIMRNRAEQLAAEREAGEVQASFDPMVDLLGSARLLCAAEDCGKSNDEARQNLQNDIRTGVIEATQENGHISVIDVPVSQTGETNIAGVPLYEMFLRGIHPGRARWVNHLGMINIHEEFLSSAHFNNESLRNNYGLVVVSPLPEDVGVDEQTLRREGFRPDSRKMMIRMHQFVPDGLGWRRVTEQLCLSGSDIKTINNALREIGIISMAEDDLTTTQVLDRPFLLRRADFPEGVAAIAQIIDELNQDKTGLAHFCGKPSHAGVPAHEMYANLRAASDEREQSLGQFLGELEDCAYKLARSDTLSFEEQTKLYEQKKLDVVRRICAMHPGYAEHAFGEEAAEHYQKAYQAVENGNTSLAAAELGSAYENSTSIVMCGIEIAQAATTSAAETSQSDAEKQEAIHCMELKIFGYTIRKEVNCPACSKITGKKVDAYETINNIKCLNGNCGYEVCKITGNVVSASATVEQQSKEKRDNVAKNPEVSKKSLQHDTIYTFGTGRYKYQQQLTVGGAEPIFVSETGQQIMGDEALWLAKMLQNTLNQPSSQVA